MANSRRSSQFLFWFESLFLLFFSPQVRTHLKTIKREEVVSCPDSKSYYRYL